MTTLLLIAKLQSFEIRAVEKRCKIEKDNMIINAEFNNEEFISAIEKKIKTKIVDIRINSTRCVGSKTMNHFQLDITTENGFYVINGRITE